MVRCAKKTIFRFLLIIAIEMAVLSVFLAKKGLGSFWVNPRKTQSPMTTVVTQILQLLDQ